MKGERSTGVNPEIMRRNECPRAGERAKLANMAQNEGLLQNHLITTTGGLSECMR